MTTRRLDRTFRIAEIFGPTIQGEGRMIGVPTWFVRFGGCDYRCSWCDSLHAVLPEHRDTWAPMTTEAIVEALHDAGVPRETHGPYRSVRGPWVTLSGGNPALHELTGLMQRLREAGMRVAMETQGSVAKGWFATLDHLCLSPKPPSSGNPTPHARVRACLDVAPGNTILKVVIFDENDLRYAAGLRDAFPDVPLYLSLGNTNVAADEPIDDTRRRLLAAYGNLAREAMARGFTCPILPQLHVLTWGNAPGV